ncbi:TonB-dependent receptor [Echinicola sp. CAU 1574]|uniref:TonB-dependent receptor n=1 Tax=Echinicola arenosa TaxID=2774144 RepID=A0ABR9AIC5_9BACT|nr:TonB-dependent receptor [Echinicola arenosa]MBD8487369.1 TonB-dependent receptor [Echinicola arenosa]
MKKNQIILLMRITTRMLCLALILAVSMSVSIAGNAIAQDPSETMVTITKDHLTMASVMHIIENQTDFNFSYNSEFNLQKELSISKGKITLSNLLNNISSQTGFEFKLINQTIGIGYDQSKANQETTLRGKVTNTEGEPLPGASILISGTSKGTVTDIDGNFTITVNSQSILVIDYVGYKAQKITVGNQDNITVVLQNDDSSLEEFVVVSYGTQEKREITGAISQLDASELQDQPVNQFAQQLQGKIAGVQVSQINGQPGRGIGFRIRGAASMHASNQPLVVIDGIPITGSINNINPSEIETFTVLKDASSAALYGSRAANGVILITTKKAEFEDSRIEFNSFYGVQSIPKNKVPDLMTAEEFAQFQKEHYEDRVKYESYSGSLDPAYENPSDYGAGTDWFNTLTQTAPIQKYNLTVLSAKNNSSTSVVAGYTKQDGVIINTGTQLYSLRINHEFRLRDNFKIGFRLAPSYRKDHNNRLGSDGLGGIVQDIVESSPLVAPINPDGSYPLYVNSPRMVKTLNPYARMLETKDDYNTTRILGNGYFNYEFIKGLSLNTNLAVDKGAETRNRFYPSIIQGNGLAAGYSSSVDNYSWTAETNLEYKKTVGDHHFEVLAGYSAQKFDQESNNVSGSNYPSDEVGWISAATSINGGSSNTTQYSLVSQLGRLNYDLKGKYFMSLAVRRDGSSRFGDESKYGLFPSVSAGWILSDEPFIHNIDAINFLKVRGSYGITGNDRIGNYTHVSNLGEYNYVFDDTLVPGITIGSLGNSKLEWERNKQLDLGLDINLLDNRLQFSYDYYHKISDGLIQNRPIPRASGFTSINSNIGVIEFWGHEFTMNILAVDKALQWNSNVNLSFNRNLIKDLVDPGYIRRNNTISSDYYRHQEGHSLGEFYGFIFEGLYRDEEDLASSPQLQISGMHSNVGTIKMKDVNGDNIINEDDRTFIGDPTPDFIFGFNNDFRYKNFDLNLSMQGAVGGKIMNPVKWAYLLNLDGARMMLVDAKDRWRSPENPGKGELPRTESGTTALGRSVNTQWIEDGTYLSVNNITLGYNINLLKKSVLQKLRVYGSIQNALVLTGYTGMNPEINVGGMDPTKGVGIDENGYPVPRTFSLGVNVTLK